MALPDPAQCWHNCILSVGIQVQKDTCPDLYAKIIMLNPVIVFYNYNGTSKASFICTIKHNQGKNKHHWDVHKLCIDIFTINNPTLDSCTLWEQNTENNCFELTSKIWQRAFQCYFINNSRFSPPELNSVYHQKRW